MNDSTQPTSFSHDGPKNLPELFPLIQGYYSPRVIGEVNDVFIKITRVKGDDVPWHTHDEQDELFYMVKGSLEMLIDGREPFTLNEGELYIVKKGVNHRVRSADECWILLIEHKSTAHTGTVESKITRSIEEQL